MRYGWRDQGFRLDHRAGGNARRRWQRRLVWAGLVVALLAVDGFVAIQKLDQGTKPRSNSQVAANGYGFSTSFDGLSGAALDNRMAALAATGVTWVRFDISWADIQPQAGGPYNWSATDAVVRSARAHGLKVLGIADLTPAWARVKNCSGTTLCAPASASAFATFAGAAAAHYRPLGVNDWEIWNEPNISYRFRPAADPVKYTDMVKDSDKTIKAANPAAVVIAGSLAPTATGTGDYAPSDFVSALYEAGAAGWFDALSIHPYTYPKLPSQTGPLDAWGQMTTIHGIMAAHGDGGKKIWITEYGAPTDGPDDPGDHVTEAVQAQMVTEAISEFRQNSWAGPFFWYDYEDAGTSTSDSENFYGLVRADGSAKPALAAFEAAIQSNP